VMYSTGLLYCDEDIRVVILCRR